MDSSEEWANAVRVAARLCSKGGGVLGDDDPSLLVQRVTSCVLPCGGPVEHYSQRMPVWVPEPGENELLPIDVLYGKYDPADRSIEIYANRISQDAGVFGATREELIEIVRIHEYAHAIVHMGIQVEEVQDILSVYGNEGTTDWNGFECARTERFQGIDEELHEFLAQSITYACLAAISASDSAKSGRLCKVFEAVERRQPKHYRISPGVKAGALACARGGAKAGEKPESTAWPVVLSAAWGEFDGVHREDDFILLNGISALVCEFVGD